MQEPFDVVLVPDFAGRQAHIQEGQALFFLAAWRACYGGTSRLPLHLACIGTPPASVSWLAERVGARLSTHAPIGIRSDCHVGNKLRGLEIAAETERILLVDVDTLVLGDMQQIAPAAGCLAAAPEDWPTLTEADWQIIYHGLGLPLPDARMASLGAELDLPQRPRQLQRCKVRGVDPAAMWPYHNGGVVLVPAACPLRTLWEDNIRRIAGLFPMAQGERKWIHRSDQAALAVSLQMLRRQGWPFQRLPDALNTRWRHLYAGPLPLDQAGLLHLTTFLHSLPRGPVTAAGLWQAVRAYVDQKLRRRLSRVLTGDLLRGRVFPGWRQYRVARGNCRRLAERLGRLWEQSVRPALEPAARELPAMPAFRKAA